MRHRRSIFTYTSANAYLKDWHYSKKVVDGKWSIRFMAKKLGKSPAFICQIINGRQPIPVGMIGRLENLIFMRQAGQAANSGYRSGKKSYFSLMVFLEAIRMPESFRIKVLRRYAKGEQRRGGAATIKGIS
jgi:hypothetical protein